MIESDTRTQLPVILVTGFLGSGKSTLINQVLKTKLGTDTAVLINEIGEISLDHRIVDSIQDNTVVLDNGCICCSTRGDIKSALLSLINKKSEGLVPKFSRIIIETTGLAMPAPIIATLISDPLLRFHVNLSTIITVVDGLHALEQNTKHPEWLAQVNIADHLLVTKTDLTTPEHSETVTDKLNTINPFADVTHKNVLYSHADDLETLFTLNTHRNWISKLGKINPTFSTSGGSAKLSHRPAESAQIYTYSFSIAEPLQWEIVTLWLSLIIHKYGQNLLRFKAILNLEGCPTPTVLHAVHHLMYPVSHLDSWSTSTPISEFVFITDIAGLDRLQESLLEFCSELGLS